MANPCETEPNALATQADRIRDLEDCIRQMANLPRCMRVCSGKIPAPEREVYMKACEYAARELRRLALMHGMQLAKS